MKRRGWIVLGIGLAAAAALATLFRPRPKERFPLAELVPAEAVFYAGFPDYHEIETLPIPWAAEIRKRLEPSRLHLSGGLAVYLDRDGHWVVLARLTRASALVAGAEIERGAAVFAETPETMARHKAREATLDKLPEFQALGSRFFVNLEPLKLRGRLHDFSALGFELQPGPPLVLRGRAFYRGGLFRTYLEQYVQAPRHGAPEGTAPLQAAFTEHFPRVWDEIIHELDPIDCEKAEREAHLLGRDYLEGRPLREFLGRLGPGWGFSIVPTPFSKPALVAWIDLPDEPTRDLARKMLHRAINDSIRLRRDRGAAPAFDVAPDGPIWRVKWVDARTMRLGEAFSPGYTFEKNRFVFSTCAATLSAPSIAAGDGHVAAGAEVGPLLESFRSLMPFFADDAFRGEAQRSSLALYLRAFPPSTMVMLKKQFPDPADLAKYQEAQRAQFEAKALEELSKTPPYQEELGRLKASIDAWASRVSWLERVSASGRFTSDGLEFEVRAWPK